RRQPRVVGTRAAVQMVGVAGASVPFAHCGQAFFARLDRGAVAAAQRVGERHQLFARFVVREVGVVERIGDGLARGVVVGGEVLVQYGVVARALRIRTMRLNAM